MGRAILRGVGLVLLALAVLGMCLRAGARGPGSMEMKLAIGLAIFGSLLGIVIEQTIGPAVIDALDRPVGKQR